jgi:hypothetical protein
MTALWVLRVAIGLRRTTDCWRRALSLAWHAREMRAAQYRPGEAVADICERGF